jgi:hypothetical protein
MSKQTSIFVRQSSGLVREASALDAMIFNAVFSAPVGATLAFGIFYALGTSPGADLVTALLIAFIVNIPVWIRTQYNLSPTLGIPLVTAHAGVRYPQHEEKRDRYTIPAQVVSPRRSS